MEIAVGIVLCVLLFASAVLLYAWRWMVWMPGKSHSGCLPPLTDRQLELVERLEHDLVVLADEIGERNISQRYLSLIEAAGFLETSLEAADYDVRRQEFRVNDHAVWNLDVEIPGSERSDEILVVGAHYDTVPGSPGANDNGSAVVANLALARYFATREPKRTIRFAFFVNEEWPYYMTDDMGSLRYAELCRSRGEHVVGMICLETIGCYTEEPQSQRYPSRWLGKIYPTTGDFVAAVGNVRSRRFVHNVVRGLRRSPFPCEGMAAPRFLKDIFRSDHAPFWHCGYSALMLTDTANFRYPHYHTAEDTVDKINFSALARLVTALDECLVALCDR